MRTRRGYLFGACYSKEVSHHGLHLAETQRQAEEWGKFIMARREGFRYPLAGGCWMRKL